MAGPRLAPPAGPRSRAASWRYAQAFGRLREYLQKRDTSAERWLEDEIRRLYTPDKDGDDAADGSDDERG